MKEICAGAAGEELAMDKFWGRKDVLLLVPGSLPCLRGVYSHALKLGKLHQFRYIRMTNDSYVLGTAEKLIRDEIRRSALRKGVKIIILYLSCLDILIRIDFKDIETKMSKETGCIVKCFFRGPLAKTDQGDHLSAEELLDVFPLEELEIDDEEDLPPPMSDAAGISDWLRADGYANALITPAGCRSCLRDMDMEMGQRHVYYTETKGADYIFGFEDTVEKQTETIYREKKYAHVGLIGSAVPSFMGFDEAGVIRDERTVYFPSDGFHDAVSGVSMAQLMTVKESSFSDRAKGKYVEVLGYSPLLCGGQKQYAHCLSFIKSLGYEVLFSGQSPERNERPSLVWVVSSAGIMAGEWIRDTWNVPLLISVPVGDHAFSTWKKNVAEMIGGTKETRTLQIHNNMVPMRYEERMIFVGDPLHTMAMAHYFWHEGVRNVCLAAYGWTKGVERIYQRAPGSERIQIFRDKEELRALCEDKDIVVADPLLARVIEKKRIVPFPWGLFSGRMMLTEESGALGIRMEKLLKHCLAAMDRYRKEKKT